MACGTGSDSGQLTGSAIANLANCISRQSMESIALSYLGLEPQVMETLKYQHRGNDLGWSREILTLWKNANQGGDQVKTLAGLLYRAAAEGGHVDTDRVEAILGIPARNPIQHNNEVTETEFLTIADAMRPHTQNAMKIEVAPWISGYSVTMEQLYTELTLQTIETTPEGIKASSLTDYRQLFAPQVEVEDDLDCWDSSGLWSTVASWVKSMCCPSAKAQQKKYENQKSKTTTIAKQPKMILVIGDPGMGKTTLAKKMAYDWAKGIFNAFTMVFFISLNLVCPSDSIEALIIRQNPWIEGLGITEQKLRQMLCTWGSHCLLILDGLDEHRSGSNQHVYHLLRRRKLSNCNVIATSRSHCVGEFHKFFDTLVRIEGFSVEQATRFACSFHSDRQKILAVLERTDLGQNTFLYKCPILLSFLCILVKEEDTLAPPSGTLVPGEMYTRMVKCLYKKYSLRKRIEYASEDFTATLTRLGSLAWKTLTTGNYLLSKTHVLSEVGEDVFDLGLLIGETNFRPGINVTSDVTVTWPHQTLEEFFGAFYCVWTLSEGHSLERLLAGSQEHMLFLTNPMFVHFCLWFMTSSQSHFEFNKKNVYGALFDHYGTQFG